MNDSLIFANLFKNLTLSHVFNWWTFLDHFPKFLDASILHSHIWSCKVNLSRCWVSFLVNSSFDSCLVDIKSFSPALLCRKIFFKQFIEQLLGCLVSKSTSSILIGGIGILWLVCLQGFKSYHLSFEVAHVNHRLKNFYCVRIRTLQILVHAWKSLVKCHDVLLRKVFGNLCIDDVLTGFDIFFVNWCVFELVLLVIGEFFTMSLKKCHICMSKLFSG